MKRKSPAKKQNQYQVAKRVNVSRQDYYFKRYIQNPTYITGNIINAPYLAGWSFKFNQLVNVSEFANLFDAYSINKIVVRWFLKVLPDAQTASTATMPKIYFCSDFDDANPPASLNELREHSRTRVKVMNPNYPVTFAFKPAIADTVFRTGATTSTVPKWNQWLDMANTDIEHYGVKWGIDDLTNTNYRVDVEVIYYFKCKGLR